MDEFLARTNISKFRAQLETSSDEAQKATLRQLLKSEEGRLSTILAQEIQSTADYVNSAEMNGETAQLRNGLKSKAIGNPKQ